VAAASSSCGLLVCDPDAAVWSACLCGSKSQEVSGVYGREMLKAACEGSAG